MASGLLISLRRGTGPVVLIGGVGLSRADVKQCTVDK
jgi:hypothetical protein